MKKLLITGVLSLVIFAPIKDVSAADNSSDWFIFNGSEQKCEPGPNPADIIREYRELQEGVTVHDEKDSTGKVVATTLGVPMGSGQIGELELFRGLDRCQKWIDQRNKSLDRYD